MDYVVNWVDSNNYVLSWQVGGTTNIIATIGALSVPSDATYKSTQAGCDAWFAPQESYNRANNQTSQNNYGYIFCTNNGNGYHCLQNMSFPDNLCVWPVVNMPDSCDFKLQRNSQCSTCTYSQCSNYNASGPTQTACPSISSNSRYQTSYYYFFACGPIQCYVSTTNKSEQFIENCSNQCYYGNCTVASCNNDCSTGQTKCNGSFSQVCGNYDSDNCIEWPFSTSGNGNTNCITGCNQSTGTCNDCTSHTTSSCYNNDLYWFDSCGQIQEIKTDCGDPYYSYGAYYCSGNNIAREKTFFEKGCSNNSCYTKQTPIQETIECQYGCSNGQCIGSIQIRTIDKWNNPISGARIFANGTLKGTTDQTGYFSLQTLPGDTGKNYSINAITENGTNCGTKNTTINFETDKDNIFFVCNVANGTLVTTITTDKANYSLGETINFDITVRDQSNNAVSNAQVGIFDPIKQTNHVSVTNSLGQATYSTVASNGGTLQFSFSATKNGYSTNKESLTVTVSPGIAALDSDGDGLVDSIEKTLGTSPNDPNSNLVTIVGSTDFGTQCTYFMPLGIFSMKQKEQITNELSSDRTNSVEEIKNSNSLSTQQRTSKVPFYEAIKKADTIQVFKKKDGTIIVLTDNDSSTVSIFILSALCEGFYKGIAYGVTQGITDDSALLFGITYYAFHSSELESAINKISPSLNKAFLQTITYTFFCHSLFRISEPIKNYCQQTENNFISGLSEFIHNSINSILFTANQANKKYQANQLEKAHFETGFIGGYISGYVAEQAIIAHGMSTITKTGIKTATKIFTEVGPEAINIMKNSRYSNWLFEIGEDGSIGIGRIGKAKKTSGALDEFLDGLTKVEATQIGEKINKITKTLSLLNKTETEISNAIEIITKTKLGKTYLKEWNEKQLLGYTKYLIEYPDKQGNAVINVMRQEWYTDQAVKTATEVDDAGNFKNFWKEGDDRTKFPSPNDTKTMIDGVFDPGLHSEYYVESRAVESELDYADNLTSKIREEAEHFAFSPLGGTYDNTIVIVLKDRTTLSPEQIKSAIWKAYQESSLNLRHMMNVSRIGIYDDIEDKVISLYSIDDWKNGVGKLQ